MKFKIIKRFSLDFLGTDWKEAFIDFKPFSITDIKIKLPEIAKFQGKEADVDKGIDNVLELLRENFISGKAIVEDGTLKDLTAKDLGDLPFEVIGRAFSFLSQINIPSPTSTP